VTETEFDQARRQGSGPRQSQGEALKRLWITAAAATTAGFLAGFVTGSALMAARLGEDPLATVTRLERTEGRLRMAANY
jgi:hypothetical protein